MKSLLSLLILAAVFSPLNSLSQTTKTAVPDTVYQSDNLIIIRLSDHVYVHVSFFKSVTFGNVPCNGMLVTDKKEALVFDTPADDTSSAELVNWINKKLDCKIKAVIPTHFHEDCLGGLKIFHANSIVSYATHKTIELAKSRSFNIPVNGFKDAKTFIVGDKQVLTAFPGEGHTQDNIVAYVPHDKILFGGCLIKEMNAGKGNLADANVKAWPATVQQVLKKFPHVKTVIPGHGLVGDKSLLDYTIKLFNN